MRLFPLVISVLAVAASCNADVFVFDDQTDIILVTMNGVPLTVDGGPISNFDLQSDFVSFDVDTRFSGFFLRVHQPCRPWQQRG